MKYISFLLNIVCLSIICTVQGSETKIIYDTISNRHSLLQHIVEGNSEEVDLWIKNGLSVNFSTDRSKKTPLHFALESGQTDIADQLINAGADLKSVTINGDTPLHYAVRYSDITTVKKLLSENVNIKNNKKYTPLHIAAYECSLDKVQTLVNAGASTDIHSVDGPPSMIALSKLITLFKIKKKKNKPENLKTINMLIIELKDIIAYLLKQPLKSLQD
jgi:ankyrin repeat protein